MFRNRSSQKPDDNLYAHFKANFGNVVGGPRTARVSPRHPNLNAGAVDPSNIQSPRGTHIHKDLDPTPRAQHDAWRFTPSLLDPNSFAFSNFANQMPGYYTPGHSGGNTLYHNQAGDLHTPGMSLSMGVGTPLSMHGGDSDVHPGTMMDFPDYMPQSFENYTGFVQPAITQEQMHQSYAPATFVMHHDTGYETMDHDGSPMHDGGSVGQMEVATMQPTMMTYQQRRFDMDMTAAPLPPAAEKFRFHAVLNAPTAMIKSPDEIPVTYLNKGQAYSVSIVDTQPMVPVPAGTRYRSFVRISFEDEQQRQRPAGCWQLWKEGRGTNEAHQRGGRLQAVEFIDASQQAESDDRRTRVELETASFDGFSVIWTPGATGHAECNLAVRFNFLSTDFSHSKGVKGIPVRFCAKTEVLDPTSQHAVHGSTEVAYCKVKLFRDHGAERKLSNDVQHVKKTIDKLQQQMAQSEAGMKDFGKRKRTGSISKSNTSQRAGKIPKHHKRAWSISSASSAGGHLHVEEDLQLKLQQQQDMFTSTRPVSILFLHGSEQDDPDLHPVVLQGESLSPTKLDPHDGMVWQHPGSLHSTSTAGTGTCASSFVSPSPSSTSLHSQTATTALLNTSISASANGNSNGNGSSDYRALLDGVDFTANPQHLASPPDHIITKIPRTDSTGGLSGWIEALGVDTAYSPPAERPVRAVACLYVQYRDASSHPGTAATTTIAPTSSTWTISPIKPPPSPPPTATATTTKQYYRAIYLAQRTLRDLLVGIATKRGLDPSSVRRVVRVLPSGIEVEMDDDVVREMREGQDMGVEFMKLGSASASASASDRVAAMKGDWEMTIDGDENESADGVEGEGVEMRLSY